ncbi:MAG: hypothetical protein AMJ81_11685 [Phycisphaerae bacterium SM23_33]|nr:MAG: hypothetical protein AMJ81_11685 [Phycisphaerae bacterium SM23_33]
MSVALNGRARDRNVVHDFVSELNRSPMFARAGLGPMVEDAEDPKFPTRFSVTFYLRRRG